MRLCLGLCAAQYFTVLVGDLGLHFYLATVLLFVAYTLLLAIMLQADARAARATQAGSAGGIPGAPDEASRSIAA